MEKDGEGRQRGERFGRELVELGYTSMSLPYRFPMVVNEPIS